MLLAMAIAATGEVCFSVLLGFAGQHFSKHLGELISVIAIWANVGVGVYCFKRLRPGSSFGATAVASIMVVLAVLIAAVAVARLYAPLEF